jgi:predicted PurR-regulated permease PerM
MSEWTFIRRVLIVLALLALAAALWVLSDILLMAFGAILVAVVLRSLMEPLVRATGINQTLALILIVAAIVGVVVGLILPFGPRIAEQAEYLFERLPGAVTHIVQEAELQSVAEQLRGSALGGLVLGVFSWGSTIVGALAGAVLVLVGGIYLAADPGVYRSGLIKLFPKRWHDLIAATMDDASFSLRRWLGAQLVAMLAVGVLTGVGMWLAGVPSPLALGLIAGILEFVPYIGPIVGAIPALLLASTESLELVLWALAVAIAVQQIENNIIMPFIVGRVVELPAAVALFAVVALGIVFGPLGLMLGYPLAIVLDVAVRRLYVREALGQRVSTPAERAEAEAEARPAA